MASGIARGRVRTTTTTVESHKMAAIPQIIGWQRHAALVCHVLLINGVMLWSIETCQIKLSAGQYQVTTSRAQVFSSSRSRVLWKLNADQVDQVLVFDSIAGSWQINLLKTEPGCSEDCYLWSDCFSFTNAFLFTAFVFYISFVIIRIKIEGETI